MTNNSVKYVDVSLNVPVDKAFTYSVPQDIKTPPIVGSRAEVSLSGRRMTGIITAVHESLCSSALKPYQIKSVTKIIDSEPLLNDELLSLARWMASYYLCSYGEVLCAMVPSAKRVHESAQGMDDSEWGKSKVCLSQEQQQAVDGIVPLKNITGGKPQGGAGERLQSAFHYLYGPTGSGKTEVFLSAAERVMRQGRGVIYLVPEIALTPQVERAVNERFAGMSAVLHSALTPSERLKEWQRIIKKEARVVIGARSAVFAPVPDLGLIIIDEENDGSYKSSNTPRYHARQVAMRRALTLGIPLVMGSATPSVESWYAIKSGTFVCHTLTKRLAGGAMPHIMCVDLKQGAMKTTCFSKTLVEEVRKALSAKRQVILFLNRRGFTHFFRCMDCGFELQCPNCSVAMTYHKAENRLRCHYCGKVSLPLGMCPNCGSLNIGYSGFGTEAVEAEAKMLFPNARIERADADSVSKKHTLEEVLTRFRNGECDILLGTQMVAKGLNFPSLSLVGVMLADTALHFPDFRAVERAFSLITQVAGRAGRYFPDGKVIVQTYAPNNPAINYAVQSDAESFYKWELEQRRMASFPPFSRLVHIVFRSADENAALAASEEAAAFLQDASSAGSFFVLGPAQCPLYKIARNFRRQLLLNGKHIAPMQQAARLMLNSIKKRSGVFIETDVDPVSML